MSLHRAAFTVIVRPLSHFHLSKHAFLNRLIFRCVLAFTDYSAALTTPGLLNLVKYNYFTVTIPTPARLKSCWRATQVNRTMTVLQLSNLGLATWAGD